MRDSIRSALLGLPLAAVSWTAQALPFHLTGSFSGTTHADVVLWVPDRPPLEFYEGAPATGTFEIFVPDPTFQVGIDPSSYAYYLNGGGGYLKMGFDFAGEHFDVYQGTPPDPWGLPSVILLSASPDTVQTHLQEATFLTDFMPKYGGGSMSITAPDGALFDGTDATTLHVQPGAPLSFSFGFVASSLGYGFGFTLDEVRWRDVSAPVPEPAPLALLVAGLGLIAATRRRR